GARQPGAGRDGGGLIRDRPRHREVLSQAAEARGARRRRVEVQGVAVHQKQGVTSMSGQIVPFKERVNTFRGALEALKPQLAAALPKHMTADRMMRIVMTTV